MFQSLELFTTSYAMSRHAGQRQSVAARNMANADTPGYRAQSIPDFAETMKTDVPPPMRATRPGHLHFGADPGALTPQDAGLPSDPNGNSVSLEQEMLRSVAAKRQHDRALAIYRAGLTILRTSLGK